MRYFFLVLAMRTKLMIVLYMVGHIVSLVSAMLVLLLYSVMAAL